MKLRALHCAQIAATLLALVTGTAYAAQTATNYSIPLDVLDAGGSDVSKSSNYLLSDSVGEPIVGYGSTSNYILNSGYRQPSAADFLSMTCSPNANIGSVVATGQKTGSGTCTVYTDAYNGYNLSWAVNTGSGGTNTGYLISQYNDTIAPFDFSGAGLVGYWKLDETSAGSTVKDYSGHGYSGTPNGISGSNNYPQPSSTLPPNMNVSDLRSLNYDGTDDYVDVGDIASMNGASKLTISAWMKRAASNSKVDIAKNIETGVNLMAIELYSDGNVYFDMGLTGNEYGVVSAPGTEWYHVVWVFDGTQSGNANRLKGYVNGVQQTLSFVGTIGATTPNATGYPLYIGKLKHSGSINAFSAGNIDDVRVYTRPLSSAEVQALYRTPHTWSVAATAAGWGSRLSSRSTDSHSKWGTDGGTENWLNVGDGSYSVITRGSATTQSGSTEILQFRAEVGSSVLQPTGVYRSTITLTVVGY